MTRLSITQILEKLNIHPEEISDQKLSQAFRLLLNLVESISDALEGSSKENQNLRDENNRLKGEQGKPDIPSSKKKDTNKGDISSEKERKDRALNQKKKKSKAKKPKIKIDRTEVCNVDQSGLPDDAEFKGYQDVTVQGVLIKRDNVLYQREIYYSRSQGKTYLGALPAGVEGEFSPEVKSLIFTMYHVANVSEPKIHEFLKNIGIYISPATISRVLTKKNELFHQEKDEIFRAGLTSTAYQQIDDTGARVRGENQHVQIICNPYYTAYFTGSRKDRLSVLDILGGGKARSYYFNEEAFDLLELFGLSRALISKLRDHVFCKQLDDKQMQELLERLFSRGKGKTLRSRIMEAGAIAAYHNQTDFPVVSVLLSDNAPQFNHIIKEHGLCWIHEGRHFKKLDPVVPIHRKILEEFQTRFWDYYQQLLRYKANPTPQKGKELSAEFDSLFVTQTNYQDLDERIAKTKAKKQKLLLVLKYPELPLHNNESELGARAQARRRDVSFHTMTEEGTKAKDTFMTIVQTARKLGVSAYEYIHDRVSKSFNLPSLAELIVVRSSSESACYNAGFT